MNSNKIPFFRSLRGRLLLYLVVPLIVVSSVVIVFRAINTFAVVREQNQRQLRNLAEHVAIEVERGNTRAVLAAKTMALAQEESLFGRRAESSAFARRVLEEFPEFTGSSFGYEPNADQRDAEFKGTAAAEKIGPGFDDNGRFIPYWYRDDKDGGKIKLEPLVDMETSLYYDGCRKLYLKNNRSEPLITEPYVYEGKMVVEQTYPIIIDGKFAGVATVDRALRDIAQFLDNIKQTRHADVILFSSRGRFICSTLGLGHRTKYLRDTEYSDLLMPLFENRAERHFSLETDPTDGERYYFVTAPVPTGDWMVVLRESEDYILGPIRANIFQTTSISAVAVLVIVGMAWWFVTMASRRIQDAMLAAERMASGDLSHALSAKDEACDEIGAMFQSFNQVIDSYRQVSDVCTSIAGGDFSNRVTKRSEKDSLADAINRMADVRQQAEQELAEAEERSRLLLDSASEGIFGVDTSGIITFVNPAACQMLGYDVSELIGQDSHGLLHHSHPDGSEYPAKESPMYEAFTNGRVSRIDDECLWCKGGANVPVEYGATPMLKEGEITGAVISFTDITERKQANELIQQQKVFLETVLDSLTHPFYVIDVNDYSIKIMNTTARKMGQEGALTCHAMTHRNPKPCDSQDDPCPLEIIKRTKAPAVVEHIHYDRQGNPINVEVHGYPIFDAKGNIVQMIEYSLDITERKKMLEELEHARDDANEANRAKSKFLANMSHELRTPMNAIIGYSEMLVEEAEDLEQDEFIPDLKRIHGAGKHLLALINDILDISKIEAGKMDLYLEQFNVEHMLDEVRSTVDTLVSKKNNKFVLDCSNSLGDMHTDLTKIRQSLFNLISNAAKFTENGTVTLSAKRKNLQGQEWIEFNVSDTGIGIAEDKIGILFDEFTQADDSTTRNYGGTGLGLAITKRFCEMMGGTISITSKLGEGSTFSICLPAELSSEEEDEVTESVTEEVKSSITELAPKSETTSNRILVIDDDPNMLDMMTKFLEKEGYEAITASSGEEGLKLAKELHPTVITLDVLMPQVDGWKVLKSLKSDPETRDIPVIMLTVMSDKSMGLSLGAMEYLSKPVDRDHLLRILNRCCPGKSSKPILVLEDDTTMREMLCRTLVKEGWEVREACNGKVALEQVRREVPAMILLDLLMPVMDGFTFLKELRKVDHWRDIPVLVITSKDITREEKQLLEEKVVTIMQKGEYTRQNLLDQVSSAIKHFIS